MSPMAATARSMSKCGERGDAFGLRARRGGPYDSAMPFETVSLDENVRFDRDN